MTRFFHAALLGMILSCGAFKGVEARALLVVGSTEDLWPIDPNLTIDTREWAEVAAQRTEATHPQQRGIVLLNTSSIHIGPFFLTPDFNLSPGYLERGGWERTRIGERDKQFFRALDGDIDTFYFFAGVGYGNVNPTLDLGGIFPVNRIVFYTHPDRREQYAPVFTLNINDGDPATIDQRGNPIWKAVREETENNDALVETVFRTQPVRFVSLLPQTLRTRSGVSINPKTFEIAEFEIYGEGFVPSATYISEIIDISGIAPELPGEQASWGKLHWIGDRDKDARVVIRTRTGRDDDPSIYWWDTGRGGELSTLKVNGEPLTLSDYKKVPPTQRGPITYDSQQWSFWSPPFDFDKGVEGVPIPSPGPRRFFQFRIDFFSTITDGSRIESIGFDFSKPPSARAAVAEVFPRDVEAAVNTTFRYFLRTSLGTEDRGFDSLEIETFVRPSAVRSVRILSESVEEVDLSVYPPEILDDRLIVHFRRFGVEDTQKLLEVVFDAMVVKFGTEFSGRIFEQDSDEVRQLVDAGDATDIFSGGGLSISTPLTDDLISSVAVVPNVFTPNGDGINDEARITYAILNLTEAADANLIIFDLSGRQIRQLQTGELLSGSFEFPWDGQADDGGVVPPGNYIYQITVESDERREHRTGIVALTY